MSVNYEKRITLSDGTSLSLGTGFAAFYISEAERDRMVKDAVEYLMAHPKEQHYTSFSGNAAVMAARVGKQIHVHDTVPLREAIIVVR